MPDLDIDSEHVITLVKNRPALWDKTSENYKDRNATKKAWEEICNLLHKDFETLDEKDRSTFQKEVMRRWTNIRDSFVKFCRKEIKTEKNGARASKKKKYVYHNQMRFMRKLYDSENGELNEDVRKEDAPRIDTETLIASVYRRSRSQDTELVSNTGGEDNLASAETSSTMSRLSDSICNRSKQLDESKHSNAKVLGGEKSDRHLSFFKGIVPSLEDFNEQEVLKFQMGVLQLIGNINDSRQKTSLAQLPAQFFSFPSQPGPSAYLPYSSGQPIFPTFWSPVCNKCNSDSVLRESISSPVVD